MMYSSHLIFFKSVLVKPFELSATLTNDVLEETRDDASHALCYHTAE